MTKIVLPTGRHKYSNVITVCVWKPVHGLFCLLLCTVKIKFWIFTFLNFQSLGFQIPDFHYNANFSRDGSVWPLYGPSPYLTMVHPEDYMVSFCYVVLFCFERRNILGQLFWHKWWLFIRIGCMMPTSAVSKSHKFSITIIDEVLFGQLWAKDKQELNSPLIIFK